MKDVYPEPDSITHRRACGYRLLYVAIIALAWKVGKVVGLDAHVGLLIGLAIILIQSFRKGSEYKAPDFLVDGEQRSVVYGERVYPIDVIEDIRLFKRPNGMSTLRIRAKDMSVLKVSLRPNLERAAVQLVLLNPSITCSTWPEDHARSFTSSEPS